jgi:hypothetical protein
MIVPKWIDPLGSDERKCFFRILGEILAVERDQQDIFPKQILANFARFFLKHPPFFKDTHIPLP